MIGAVADGAAEDLIRSFVQLTCAEGHLKTLLEKYTAELENKIDPFDNDSVQGKADEIADIQDELVFTAELRRGVMLRLFNMYHGNKDYWCMVKHLGSAAYTLFEAYQATDDEELLTMALDANRRFVKAMTRFLGTEVTDCAACFADFLKGEK